MSGRISKLLIAAWLTFISIEYLSYFPPRGMLTGLPSVSSVSVHGQIFADIAFLLIFFFAATGYGLFFWRNARAKKTEILLFSAGTGIGVISAAVLLLNSVSCANNFSVIAVLSAGLTLFILYAKVLRFRPAKLHASFAIAALLPLLSTLVGALAPPTQFDSLVYHLALPQKYIDAGRMYFVKENFFFSFPQNMEMLYQAAMLARGDIFANLIHWLFLPLTGLAVFSFARRYWDVKTALIASAAWMFSPAVMFLAAGTYVDLGLAFFVFMSFYAFMLWRETGDNSWIAAAGVFSGVAAGIKYTAMAPAAIIAVLACIHAKRVRPAVLFSSAALLVFAPWLIKNWVFVHNPVSPWGTGIFTGSLLTAEHAKNYFSHISGHGMPLKNPLDFIMLPWNLTIFGFRYGGGFDMPGPVFLLLLPLLFLSKKIDKIDRVLIVFSLAFGLAWLVSGKVLRFLIPVIPFLCLLSARGIVSTAAERPVRNVAYVILAIVLLHNLLFFHWTMTEVDPYSPVLRSESRQEYLGRKLNYFPAAHKCVNNLPDRAKVLFLGETRSYYFAKDSVIPTVFDKNPFVTWANNSENSDKIHKTARDNGVTHILINNYEYARLGVEKEFTENGLKNFLKFKRSFLTGIYKDAYCEVYRIK
ncbi:MAG: glycosyltransferase family 39 protein [Elusimicrobiota bacterium]